MKNRMWLGPLALMLVAGSGFAATGNEEAFVLPGQVDALMGEYCYDCHDSETQKGDVQLDALDGLKLETRLDLLNHLQAQVHFGEMPPRDKKKQPTDEERQAILDWVSAALDKHDASKLEDKLRKAEFGNYVDHEALFSGEHAHLKGYTPNRRWLINEYIFDAKMNVLLRHNPFLTIDGKREGVIGSNNRRIKLTNPFLLPPHSGVRYYDTTILNGGHLLTMIGNAKRAAETMTTYLSPRDSRYLPALDTIMKMERDHEALLAKREQFLLNHIGRLLPEVFGDRHQALLPAFVPVEIVPVAGAPDGTEIKKAPYHAAQPGREGIRIIFYTVKDLARDGESDESLIARCQEEWFYYGHSDRLIQRLVTFMNGYMEEWRKQMVQHKYEERNRREAYKPLDDPEMDVVLTALRKHRKPGDRYVEIVEKCMAQWTGELEQQRIAAGPPAEAVLAELVDQLFGHLMERESTDAERAKYVPLAASYIDNLGNLAGIQKLIQTLMLRSDFVYRSEFGEGEADAHGRKMLSPRDASYAIAYALTDSSPDEELVKAVETGRLSTREDYRREVERMLRRRDQVYVIDEGVARLDLTASFTRMPIRELRFFREFFGYPNMLPIFKDNKRFGGNYDKAKGRLVGEADRLVDHIVEKDQDVFEQLLTTDAYYVYHSGDNAAMQAASERIRTIYDYFRKFDWAAFTEADLGAHQAFIKEVEMRGMGRNPKSDLATLKRVMTSFTLRFDKGQKAAAPYNAFPAHGPANASTRTGMQLRGPEVAKFFNIALDDWDYPAVQPAPMANRKGLLTHPAWLIAHAQNTETDPVRRGKWIREKLLAGTIPDTPITVEAVVPEDHHNTLRTRLARVTEEEYCWKCHVRMNPLGYAFEIYDDFGRFREQESLEHPDNLLEERPSKAEPHVDLRDLYKTLPVVATGQLSGTGEPDLDGPVKDALELTERLAQSAKVRQSIIRHAFRYFMGRNEFLSDSKTLMDADRAYVESGGSFDEVIVSLLTSDSFIYRK